MRGRLQIAGALGPGGEGTLERVPPAPSAWRGLAASPLFDLFHALSFCVELFKREIRGSFMLMCRTKAEAYGAGRPGRCPEAGLGREGRRHPACACLSRAPGTDKTTLHSCKHKASGLWLLRDRRWPWDCGTQCLPAVACGNWGTVAGGLLLSQESRLLQKGRENQRHPPDTHITLCLQKLSLLVED